MANVPRVFLSAVTADFGLDRLDKLAKTVHDARCLCVYRNNLFHGGDILPAKLRDEIGESNAVIHLVGPTFGHGPRDVEVGTSLADDLWRPACRSWWPLAEFPTRRSYTQMELDFAFERRRPVFVLFIDDPELIEKAKVQPEEEARLQSQHRRAIAARSHEYLKTDSIAALENLAGKLPIAVNHLKQQITERDEALDRAERAVERHGKRNYRLLAGVAASILLGLAILAIIALRQSPSGSDTAHFAGKWEATNMKIQPIPASMTQTNWPLMEILAGAFANHAGKATLEVTNLNQYILNITAEDRGTVKASDFKMYESVGSSEGFLTFTSALSAQSSRAHYMTQANDKDGHAWRSTSPDEILLTLFLIKGPLTGQSSWVAKSSVRNVTSRLPLQVIGNWATGPAPFQRLNLNEDTHIWDGSLEITPQGTYHFKAWRDQSGLLEAKDSKLTFVLSDQKQIPGSYSFGGANRVTTADAEGSITWKRVGH
jgi:hypothetical protein